MTLNTIVADSLNYLADELEAMLAKGVLLVDAVQAVVFKTLKDHRRVIFNGNGYSEEWIKEAERRGLPNLRTNPEAISTLSDSKNVQLFERLNVLSKNELVISKEISNLIDFYYL
jgi:glutamine synthetase